MAAEKEAQKIIREIADSYQTEVQDALNGNLEPYRYWALPYESGCTDYHFNKRKHLSMALVYGSWSGRLPEPQTEKLVRALFLEEVVSRERDSFQGIGLCLEILTELLNQYHRDTDKELFQRAKEANFDCHCGYHVPESVRRLEQCDLEDCFWLAFEFERKDKAQMILDKWKTEQTVWNKNTYTSLYEKERWLEDKRALLRTAQNLFEWNKQHENNWEICSAADKLMKACLDVGEQELGKQVWREIPPRVDAIYKPWYRINLGRFLLEDSVDLVIQEQDVSGAAEIWNWAVPFLEKGMSEFSGNLYEKICKAAGKMGNKKLAEEADMNWSYLKSKMYKK